MTDLRSDVELGRLDLQLGDLIDCCSFRGRTEYQVRYLASFCVISSSDVLCQSCGQLPIDPSSIGYGGKLRFHSPHLGLSKGDAMTFSRVYVRRLHLPAHAGRV